MKRLVVYVLALLLGVVATCLPATPAVAASVVIMPETPMVTVRAGDDGYPVADIMVCADFDQAVAFVEALVSFTDNVRGYAQDGPGGGRTQHWCGIYLNVGPLPPGSVIHATVDWSANNGNGLSEGHATNGTSFTVPGSPPIPKKTPQQKADLGHASNAMKVACAVIAVGGIIISVATAGVAAAVMGLLAGGVCAWMAADLSDLAIDPPDADYKVTVVPNDPNLGALTSSLKLDGAAATAFGALRAQWEAEAGLADAMVAALYKSEGAAAAGDSQWESTQTLAAAGFAKQLATDLDAEPALRAAVVAAIGSAGGPITKDAIDKEKVAWSTKGITARQTELLSLGKSKSPIPEEVHAFVDNADSSTLTQPNGLAAFGSTDTSPGTVNAAEAAATAALRDWADTLTAHPVGAVPGSGPSPSPSDTSSPTPTGPTPGPVTIPANSALKDGGFESTPLTDDSFITIEPADAAKLGPGWVIDSGSIDLIGPEWGSPAAEGLQFIDLNGNGKVSPATIHIDVPTRAGHTYQVSFQMAANVLDDPNKSMTASFGAGHKDFTSTSTGHSNDDLGWGSRQFTGDACKASTRLIFTSTTKGTRGPLLDGIAVTDLGDQGGCGGGGVPLWLIIGIALVVLVAAAAITLLLIMRNKRSTPPPSGGPSLVPQG